MVTTAKKPTIALLVFDVIALFVVFNVMGWLRGIISWQSPIVSSLAVPLILLVASIHLIDGYRARTDMMSLDYTSQHIIALLSSMLGTLLLTYVVIPGNFSLQGSRAVIALSFLILIPITLSYRRIIHQRRANAVRGRSIVFLGDREACRAFRLECGRHALEQPVVYSLLPTGHTEPSVGYHDGLRPYGDVFADIESGRLPVEAIVLRESTRELPVEIARNLEQLYFNGVPTFTLELFHQIYWRKIPLYRLNQAWLFQEGFQIAREPVFERIKRAADMGLASLGLLLAGPLIVLAAVAIKVGDRGPVFFRQNRIGRNRIPFSLVKLRTMRIGPASDQAYTQPDDPRITPVGRLLRASRIDEFPQLWNVLRGEMSLIGPRAEWDRLVEDYQQRIPCYHFRHLVRPGITGWAQVNYPYGASLEDTERKLEYDLFYIRHFSLLLDASIVLKTIHIMIFGKGR